MQKRKRQITNHKSHYTKKAHVEKCYTENHIHKNEIQKAEMEAQKLVKKYLKTENRSPKRKETNREKE